MTEIKNTNLALFVSKLKENFTIHFTKLNGEERTMYCNGNTEYDLVPAIDKPYLLVKSIFDNGFRSVNVDTVKGIVVGNKEFNVYA